MSKRAHIAGLGVSMPRLSNAPNGSGMPIPPAMDSIIAAVIGAMATIVAAFIATRRRDSAAAATPTPAGAPLSRSVPIGLTCLVLWIIPLLAFIVLPFGFYAAVQDKGTRRGTTLGLTCCGIALALAVINAAIGAYQGGHCELFFQHMASSGCVTG